MNEFFLHEQLCALEGIGKQYPQGYEYAQKVRAIADQLVSQTYRVAVVGEFKKGKSSLINALLGSSILPTDILPMTAAVNRVVYGEKERIVVQFKDGRSEERSVAELQDFGTKEDAEKEAVALFSHVPFILKTVMRRELMRHSSGWRAHLWFEDYGDISLGEYAPCRWTFTFQCLTGPSLQENSMIE